MTFQYSAATRKQLWQLLRVSLETVNMKPLLYSTLFGLTEDVPILSSYALDTYQRDRQGNWSRMDRRRDRMGNSTFWRAVSVEELPARLRVEAMILGITL